MGLNNHLQPHHPKRAVTAFRTANDSQVASTPKQTPQSVFMASIAIFQQDQIPQKALLIRGHQNVNDQRRH